MAANPVDFPVINNLIRSSSATVEFDVFYGSAGTLFEIKFYVDAGLSYDEVSFKKIHASSDSMKCYLLQTNLEKTYKTNQSRVAISSLDYCKSYWVVVTARDCVHHVSSPPEFVGLFESLKFKFLMSSENTKSCAAWISQNVVRKLSEMERYVTEDSSCAIPCVDNSHFTCGEDSSIIAYE